MYFIALVFGGILVSFILLIVTDKAMDVANAIINERVLNVW